MRYSDLLKPLLVAAACVLAGVARANDSTFGGSGADLVPLAEEQVQMKSEDVVLTAHGYEWSVQAKYVFFNPGERSVKVQVGFPEYRCDSDESDCANVAFRDLRTEVDGTAVQHRQGKLKQGHGWADFLGVVWLFDVEFPSGKQVEIRHHYRLQTGRDVEGYMYTSYVTRTGRSWAGPIGSARFTAVMPPYTRAVLDPGVPGLAASPPRLIQEGGSPRVELVLEGKNWLPKGGVHFLYNASAQLSLDRLDLAQVSAAGRLATNTFCDAGQDPDGMQRCLNELYASKGYPFKNPAIAREYYSGNPAFRAVALRDRRYWVRDASPLPAFSTAWFLPGESTQINEWSRAIASARAAAKREQAGSPVARASSVTELPLPPAPGGALRAPVVPPLPKRSNAAAPFAAVAREVNNTAEPAPSVRHDGSRCGCRLPGAPAAGIGWTWLIALAGLGALRRR